MHSCIEVAGDDGISLGEGGEFGEKKRTIIARTGREGMSPVLDRSNYVTNTPRRRLGESPYLSVSAEQCFVVETRDAINNILKSLDWGTIEDSPFDELDVRAGEVIATGNQPYVDQLQGALEEQNWIVL